MAGLSRAYKRRPKSFPLSIAGLQLWLDASDASTLFTDSAGTIAATADGDPVGRWRDKSGNARDALQSDGTLKPKLNTSFLNGKNVVYFDGTDISDILSFETMTTATIFAVFRLTIRNLFQNDRIISWRKATNTDDATATKAYVPLARRYNFNQVSSYYNLTHDTSNVNIVSNTWYAYCSSVDSSGVLKNGINNIAPSPYQGSGYDRGSEVQLGARRGTGGSGNTPNEYAQVWLSEIIWYNSALNDSDKSSLFSYINAKWSIY